MSKLHEELFTFADRLEDYGSQSEKSQVKKPLDKLEQAANEIGKAWSGSWLGYHANIYYHALQPPPSGAHFSPEWGLMDTYAVRGSTGDWDEFDSDEIDKIIHKIAGNPDLIDAKQLAEKAKKAFHNDKHEVLSILSTVLSDNKDSFITRLKDDLEKIKPLSQVDIIKSFQPSGSFMSRDSLAMTQGFRTPPHLSVLSEVLALRQSPHACYLLSQIARRAASHLSRQERQAKRSQEVGTNVFIGHGQSHLWKDLKDFIQDRLGLPWDEFNRVPVAGITNIARLSEMLDASAIAFLVMTAEDELSDGKLQARTNVIHEAGLFQGRL